MEPTSSGDPPYLIGSGRACGTTGLRRDDLGKPGAREGAADVPGLTVQLAARVLWLARLGGKLYIQGEALSGTNYSTLVTGSRQVLSSKDCSRSEDSHFSITGLYFDSPR